MSRDRLSSVTAAPRGTAADGADAREHHNLLLDALPADDYGRLAPHLERVRLDLGDVLYEPGTKLRHVHFPTTSIVSLLYRMENGASAEIAVAGTD